MPFVLDASAAAKLVLDEPASLQVRTWFEATAGEVAILAPRLLAYELGRAIERFAPAGDPEELAAVLEAVLQHVLEAEARDALVFHVASGGLTFYDAAYVALAKERQAALVTFDERMAKAAAREGVALAPPGLAD